MDEDEIARCWEEQKRFILAVNEMNTQGSCRNIWVLQLGYENLNIISATQGYGLGDLLDEIIKEFPENKYTGEEDDVIKLRWLENLMSEKVHL